MTHTVTLGAALDMTAAGPLTKELLAVRGKPVALDASNVIRVGGQCLQVLLSAQATWAADGQPFEWWIESADQQLGEDATGLLLGLWPDIKNQIGPVSVTISSRLKPQGDEIVKGPFTMAVGEDKVDFRCSGRLFRLKVSGASIPTFARLGQIAVEMRPAGKH